MNDSSLVGHILELAELTDKNSRPPDQTVSTFFRQKRYLGAADRRFISGVLFGIIRNRRFIEALLEEYVRQCPHDAVLDSPHLRYLALFVAYAAADPGSGTSPREIDVSLPFPHNIDSLWSTYFPATDLPAFVRWVRDHQGLDFLDEPPAAGGGVPQAGSAPGRRRARRRTGIELIRLAVQYSFQDWMVREWHFQFGANTEKLLRSLNSPARITLRVNLSKTSREECRNRLLREGIVTEPTAVSPAGLVAAKRFNVQASQTFKNGWFELQDEGSQLISLIAHPEPGSVILDACAGAGGKSLHLADLLKGEGRIFAIDIERSRLDELDTRARRAGVANIRAVIAERLLPDMFSADLVLVDAPCTGVGTIRRNPGIKWRMTESLVTHYAARQRRLLDSSSRFVRQGGVLMYATCSLLRQENEEVVGSFLAEHAGFQVQPVEPQLCPPSMISAGGFATILPYDADTDGFFAAKLVRAG